MRFRRGWRLIGCSWIKPMTEVIWCSSSRRQHQIPSDSIRIGSTDVQPVTSIRDLGVYIDADMTMRTHVTAVVRACFAALRQIRSVQRSLSPHALLTCLCSDCQQGGLLQLSPRWYIVPAARPAAVRIECRRPSGFLSKAVRTHNPIAPWASLAESSGAGHFPAMRSGIPLPSWNSAVLPCCELSPDIWRWHSPSSAFCRLSHAGRTFYQTYTTLGDRAFPVASARAWNSLPSSVRNAPSLMTFRRDLKTVLFRSSFDLH